MILRKRWKVDYYYNNLTEKVEKEFYTFLGAFVYGMYATNYWSCKVRVSFIEEKY